MTLRRLVGAIERGRTFAGGAASPLALAFALTLGGGAARADQYSDAARHLTDLEERVRVMAAEFRDAPVYDPNIADRRVLDAEVLFTLKNYAEAATILLDVIEKYPNSRAYDDAIVLLGEALYQDRDLSSARRYFEQAIKKNSGSRREQAAIQRLIEIALRTGNYENVDDYLARLDRISSQNLEPSVPYVRGKYAFFRDKTDEAFGIFMSIPPTNPYYLQARYFVATIQVKKGDLGGAATSFDAVLRTQPRNDSDKDVQDLARLAIGRIYYERGQFDKAKEAYASIPRQSKYFSDAMYESAWNAIKAKDFRSAYRALDLMMLQNPDSPQAPELRLLMGNLNLRLSNFILASETFSLARGEFEPIHIQLQETLKKSEADPQYFESLLGKGMEKFDIAVFVPGKAVRWVTAEPEVARMIGLADDVGGLKRDISDSQATLERLERAVSGGVRVGIFPDLASSRARSTESLNQTIEIRKKFLARMSAIVSPHLTTDEKATLQGMVSERAILEKELKDVPLSSGGLKTRTKTTKQHLQELDARASEFNVQIQAMEAELVAIENYYIHSRSDQKIRPEDLKQPVADLRALITQMRAANENVRNEVAELSREATVAIATGDNERNATLRLAELMKRERDFFGNMRPRLGGKTQSEFDQLNDIISRADTIQSRLAQFDTRVDAVAATRIAQIREKLDAEKVQLASHDQKLGGILGESQHLGGGLAHVMLTKVTDRFYDLVVQSDVGLVDVSWGLKDYKTSNLNKLINQQKLELKSVEDDFKSLLEEEK